MQILCRLFKWRLENHETHLIALLVSGSFLMGSSLAYPMLSQVGSVWASMALEIFFLSALCFNALNILEILLYGLYTLMIGVAGIFLIFLWGTNTLADYCRLIPVYTTAASFLTVAWPSLLASIGHQPRTIHEVLRPVAAPHLLNSLDGVSIDTVPSSQAMSGVSDHTGWLHSPRRQTDSPDPILQPRPCREEVLAALVSHNISSGGRRSPGPPRHVDTVTSISLSSRASWPSEMSSIVRPFFGPTDATRVPRETSRRHDINAVGRFNAEQTDFFSSHPLMSMPRSTASV